ncbi:hypothetical protein FRB94_003131, partial [Tulasnella sp. JGI-2019a]
IQSFIAIHNNAEAVHLTAAFYGFLHIHACSSIATAAYFENILTLPICTLIAGFTTLILRWSLSCLVNETQIFNTVLDLHIECTYLDHHITFPKALAPLIFPSLFTPVLIALYQGNPA